MKIIAIYTEKTFYTVAAFQSKGKEIRSLFFKTIPLDSGEKTSDVQGDVIVTGMGGSEVWIKKIPLHVKHARGMAQAIPFQLESLLPFPITEALYCYNVENGNARLYVTQKSSLESHLAAWQELGVDPQIVSCISAALFRAVRHFYPEKQEFLVFHLGWEETFCVAVREGEVSQQISLPFGYAFFFEGLKKDLSKLGEDKIEELLLQVDFGSLQNTAYRQLSQRYEQFIKEIDRALYFFEKKEGMGEIFLSGYFEKLVLLKKQIGKQFSSRVFTSAPDLFYAIPFGLGLDAWKNDQKSVQFRIKKFVSKKMAQPLLRKFGLYYACSIFCSITMGLLSFSLVKKQEKALKTEMQTFFEGDGSLTKMIGDLKKKIETQGGTFLFDKEPPKVSGLVDFLANFSQVEGIEMMKLWFRLVEHPTVETPNKRFTVKVDCSFRAPSQVLAHAFYDTLKEDPKIDPKKGITWNRKDEEYQISFYLKT